MMDNQHHTNNSILSHILFLCIASPIYHFPSSFERANKDNKGLKILPSQQPMTFCGFALSWAPTAPHPKCESCVIIPSSTLTQTLPAQWFTPALPPAFTGTVSWNPIRKQPAWGARRAVVLASLLLPRLPAPSDSWRVIFITGVQLASDIKKGGEEKEGVLPSRRDFPSVHRFEGFTVIRPSSSQLPHPNFAGA